MSETGGLTLRDDPDDPTSRILCTHRSYSEGDLIETGRCLLFSTTKHLNAFLDTPGVPGKLGGPILHIDKLQKNWQGEPHNGSVIAILMGVLRFVRDSQACGKRPNAVWRVNPLAGPNDGLLNLHCLTRNHCGITRGADIIVDLQGKVTDFGEARDSEGAKRFRGALHAYWGKLPKPMVDDHMAVDPPEVDAKDGGGPPHEPKDPEDGGGPPHEPKEAEAEAEAGKDGQQTNKILTADIGVGVSLFWSCQEGKPQALTLELAHGTKGNKKVPPRSVLHEWSTGEVKEMPDVCSAHHFEFKSTNAIVALRTKDGFAMKSLKDAVKETNCTHVYKHKKFEKKGLAPAQIVATKKCGFFPGDGAREEFLAIRDALAQSGTSEKSLTQLVWTLKFDNDHQRLVPDGLVLITTKQILVKVGEPIDLILVKVGEPGNP